MNKSRDRIIAVLEKWVFLILSSWFSTRSTASYNVRLSQVTQFCQLGLFFNQCETWKKVININWNRFLVNSNWLQDVKDVDYKTDTG